MATNLNKNTIIRVLSNSRDTEPASDTMTGTVSTSSTTVIGVGTSFTTELQDGSWLYYPSDNEIRQVTRVINDTTCIISDAFTNPYAGATFRRVQQKNCNRKSISFFVTAGATALIDGASVPFNTKHTFTTSGREREAKNKDFCDPIIFDSATVVGTILVSAKKA